MTKSSDSFWPYPSHGGVLPSGPCTQQPAADRVSSPTSADFPDGVRHVLHAENSYPPAPETIYNTPRPRRPGFHEFPQPLFAFFLQQVDNYRRRRGRHTPAPALSTRSRDASAWTRSKPRKTPEKKRYALALVPNIARRLLPLAVDMRSETRPI